MFTDLQLIGSVVIALSVGVLVGRYALSPASTRELWDPEYDDNPRKNTDEIDTKEIYL